MKLLKQAAAAALCLLTLTGCSSISDSVNDFIEHDANIGKNAPAVGINVESLEELNNAAAESERIKQSEAESLAEASKTVYEKQSERADELLASMTTEQKIGQLLLVRCPKNAAEQMSAYNYGGYTLYGEDFERSTPQMISERIDEIKKSAAVLPFIAVDEEGGTVVRISRYTNFREEPFSSPQLLYKRGGTELLELDTEEKSKLLKSMGINLNLAPVADISSDESSYIYPRTLGQNAENTAEAITAIVRTANESGIASCLKHFPGYGENTDTHNGSSHDSRELYEFYNRDFIPFEAGITASEDITPAVMIGHTIYDSIDPDVPASLSEPIHKALREKVGFNGVAVSDDMGMDAIKEYGGEGSVYVKGILAGNDMLCVSDGETAYSELKAAYDSGELTDEIINCCVKRILIMKLQYKIIR